MLRGHRGEVQEDGFTQDVFSASFNPDGTLLGDRRQRRHGTARWSTTSVPRLAVLRQHAGHISRFELSPDGTRLVTADADGTARIWDIARRREVGRAPRAERGHPPARIDSAALGPDGSRSPRHRARLRSGAPARRTFVFPGEHQGRVQPRRQPPRLRERRSRPPRRTSRAASRAPRSDSATASRSTRSRSTPGQTFWRRVPRTGRWRSGSRTGRASPSCRYTRSPSTTWPSAPTVYGSASAGERRHPAHLGSAEAKAREDAPRRSGSHERRLQRGRALPRVLAPGRHEPRSEHRDRDDRARAAQAHTPASSPTATRSRPSKTQPSSCGTATCAPTRESSWRSPTRARCVR